MNIQQWLKNEQETAQEVLNDAGPGVTGHTTYWTGYLDAITNAINELAGPGDVN
jgi:hypothetical protein